MKKFILILIVLFNVILIQAQNYKDVVYPTEGRSVIFDCCIEEVYDGNKVRFTKNDTASVIEAISIIKDGLTLNLQAVESYAVYNGQNYNYYAEKYDEANKKKTAGIIVGVVGLAEVLAGLIMLDSHNEPFPQLFILVGTIGVSIGTPLAISGGIEAANNKKAMEKANSSAKLSLGLTNNGVGLVLNF